MASRKRPCSARESAAARASRASSVAGGDSASTVVDLASVGPSGVVVPNTPPGCLGREGAGSPMMYVFVVSAHAPGHAGQAALSAGVGVGRCDVCGHVGEFVRTDA